MDAPPSRTNSDPLPLRPWLPRRNPPISHWGKTSPLGLNDFLCSLSFWLHQSTGTVKSRTAIVGLVQIALTTALLSTSGCAFPWKFRESTQVVAARQLTLRGLEQLHQGDVEGAEASFRQAVDASPQDERARGEYAQLLWKRGATTEAVRHMTEAVRLSGGSPKLLVELGEMQLALGDLNGAETCAQRAVQADPHHARAQVLSGDVTRRLGRYDLALEHYHWALDVDESIPAAQIAAAEIYKKKGNPRRTLATLQPLNPEKLPLEQARKVVLLRGIALKELSRPRDAIHSLTSPVVQGNPDAEILHHLAEAYWLAGEPTSAAHAARQALTLDSTRANTQSLLARIQSGAPRVALNAREDGKEGL